MGFYLRKMSYYDMMHLSQPKGGGEMKIDIDYIAKAYKMAKVVKVVLDVVKTLRDLFV